MKIEGKKIGDVLVIRPPYKRVDAAVALEFKEKLIQWVNSGNRRFILDLADVDFIDSSGLGAIISVLKALGNEGDIAICNVGETVMTLFRLTRMNRVFRIFSSKEEALRELQASP